MSRINIAVDYEAIAGNVAELTTLAPTAEVMAVVKADGYGHGLTASAAAARSGGATWLGVAQPREATLLRVAGDQGRIFSWLYGPQFNARELIAADVDVSAGSVAMLDSLAAAGIQAGSKPQVHIAVDTGLGREGVAFAQLEHVLQHAHSLEQQGKLDVVGLWSHFAVADAPGHPTVNAQIARYLEAKELAAALGLNIRFHHLANSAATLTRPDVHFDVVRPGLAVYGYAPVPDEQGGDFGLKPAMTVEAEVILVKQVAQGQGVSYGHEYVTARDTTLALVNVGYADGVFRAAGGRAPVSIRGQRYTISGRVCMDQFVVDVGPETTVREGDVVTLFGAGGPSVQEWATASDTIDYELLCRFGGLRAKRSAV